MQTDLARLNASGGKVRGPGYDRRAVTAGLATRMAHATPTSILCCDKLPHNGATLRGLALEFAGMTDQRLARWIETDVRFPSTMVDRIDLRDPLAAQCAAIAAAADGDSEALGRGLMGLATIFGDDLPRDPRFIDAPLGWLRPLAVNRVRATLARAAAGAAA